MFGRCGNVWLRGRWKLEPSAEGSMPLLGSGEKVNCEVGLKALPPPPPPAEKVELCGSVTALDRDVVLCECCGCL